MREQITHDLTRQRHIDVESTFVDDFGLKPGTFDGTSHGAAEQFDQGNGIGVIPTRLVGPKVQGTEHLPHRSRDRHDQHVSARPGDPPRSPPTPLGDVDGRAAREDVAHHSLPRKRFREVGNRHVTSPHHRVTQTSPATVDDIDGGRVMVNESREAIQHPIQDPLGIVGDGRQPKRIDYHTCHVDRPHLDLDAGLTEVCGGLARVGHVTILRDRRRRTSTAISPEARACRFA